MDQQRGSILAGMAICWLLNVAQVGVGWLLLVADVRMLPAYYVLVGVVGIVQVGYVVPIWRLLRRNGKPKTAKGLLIAAILTFITDVSFVVLAYLGHWLIGGPNASETPCSSGFIPYTGMLLCLRP